LFKEVPFDPKKDFTPISLSMYSPKRAGSASVIRHQDLRGVPQGRESRARQA
jgi:hypothetical protein